MVINPKMIKIARHSRGMTLSDLTNNTAINKAILSKIEAGITTPSKEEMGKLSAALNYPLNFFGLQFTETRYSDFFYRKRLTMPAKEKEVIDAQIEVLKVMYDRLLSLADVPPFRVLTLSNQKGLSPEAIACMARDYYKIGAGPILNMVNILEKHGIAILYLDTDSEKFDGVTTYTDKGNPIIVINKNRPNDRKRFTIAHELGHIIMHFPFRFDNDFYERMKSEKDNVYENEADRFASEFLMPSSDIFQDLQGLTYSKLALLKQYWNVSKASIVRKAKTLKCIDEKKYSFLMIELSRNGERKTETGGISFDDPQMLRKLIDVNSGQLTELDLADYLYISPEDLSEQKAVHNGRKLRISI